MGGGKIGVVFRVRIAHPANATAPTITSIPQSGLRFRRRIDSCHLGLLDGWDGRQVGSVEWLQVLLDPELHAVRAIGTVEDDAIDTQDGRALITALGAVI